LRADRPERGPIGLLRRRRGLRNLTAALALSYIGNGAGLVALVLHVQSSEGTGLAVGSLFVAQTAPRLLGPMAGAVADRVNLRRLMVACDAGGAVLFALLALLPPLGVSLALWAAANLLQAAYSPARSSMIAGLVADDEVPTAYALENTAFNLQVAVGPLVGGALVAAAGAGWALGVDAITFAVAAALIARVPRRGPRPDPDRPGLIAETRAGLAYAARSAVARTLTITLAIAVGFLAVDNVALPFLVRDTLDGGAAAYGLASGAFGIGMLAASLALAFRPGRSAAAVYLGGLAASGVGSVATGLAPAVGAAVALQAAAGVGNGLENVGSNTLIQRHVPGAMLGRMFGLVGTAAYAGTGVAALLGGLYLDLTSPRTVFVTGGIGALVALAVALAPLRRSESAGRIGAEADEEVPGR
jgi:MFS family permease